MSHFGKVARVERLFVVIIVRWQILIVTTVATETASKATSGSAETAASTSLITASLITATLITATLMSTSLVSTRILSLSFVVNLRVVSVHIVSHVPNDLCPRVRQQDSILSLNDITVAALVLRVIVAARRIDDFIVEAVRLRPSAVASAVSVSSSLVSPGILVSTLAELRMSVRRLSSESNCARSAKGVAAASGWTVSLAGSSPVTVSAKRPLVIENIAAATPEAPGVTRVSSAETTRSVVLISPGTCATPWQETRQDVAADARQHQDQLGHLVAIHIAVGPKTRSELRR